LSASRMKLAKKEYKSADLYRKMAEYQAAVVYFDGVLNNYYDTPFAEEALFRKGECLMKLKQWQEALKVFEVFLEKYPQSRLTEATRAHLKLVKGKM